MDNLCNMLRRFVIEMLKRRMLLLDEMVMHLEKVVINERQIKEMGRHPIPLCIYLIAGCYDRIQSLYFFLESIDLYI